MLATYSLTTEFALRTVGTRSLPYPTRISVEMKLGLGGAALVREGPIEPRRPAVPEPFASRARATPVPRLSERARDAIRLRHYSSRTEEAYLGWMRRYYEFHGRRNPAELGAAHVTAFLNDLATRGSVAASTQNQALAALLFLYREVLDMRLPWLDDLVHAKTSATLPVVLTRDEVRAVLGRMEGEPRLMATLLYGCGLRLLECCRLRVKDVDFGRNQITVRRGKGDKDRATMLPLSIKVEHAAHLERVRLRHERDLASGAGWVELPGALGKKLPNAGREWPWQWVFPATRTYVERETGRSADTTCTRPSFSMRCVGLCSRRGFRSARRATRSGTRLRRICSKTAATFARCRNCSATRMSRRR